MFRTAFRKYLADALDKSIEMLPASLRDLQRVDANMERDLYHMSLIYKPGGSVIDLGGGVACSLLALSQLGMDVTIIDNYNRPYYVQDECSRALGIFRSSGIKIYEMDILDCSLDFVPNRSIDRVVSFDCIEHLHHSPKGVLERAMAKLAMGGKLIISTPNAVNLLKRMKVAFGRSNLNPFEDFYFQGDPFTGHIREFTKSELLQLASWLQFESAQVIGCNWYLHTNHLWIPRRFRKAIDVLLRITPTVCSNLYLVAKKPGSAIEKTADRNV